MAPFTSGSPRNLYLFDSFVLPENLAKKVTILFFFIFIFLGVLKEPFVAKFLKADFYKDLTQDMKNEWQKRTGKSTIDSMKEFLIENVGAPINKLIR